MLVDKRRSFMQRPADESNCHARASGLILSGDSQIAHNTGFPRKGRDLVGVERRYCGELAKEDNCQVDISRLLADRRASLLVAYRRYPPKDRRSHFRHLERFRRVRKR